MTKRKDAKGIHFPPPMALTMLSMGFLLSFGGLRSEAAPLGYSAIQEVNQTKTKTVRGKVLDTHGMPIMGASVVVKGTTNGAISDADGRFELKVPEKATLVVSYVGFTTQEIAVGKHSNIDVRLEEDNQQLNEVVVVGYGTMEKKQVTNAVTSLSPDDLTTGTSGGDITSALQGKVTSLTIAGDGSVNNSSTIQLRGLTSINSGRSPLIVIDGFAGGDIRSISQEDIKSIDILKDASAGAIYGTRAASGVILITTKGGDNTDGKLKFSYSTQLTKRFAFGKPDMLSAEEYVAHEIGTDYGSSTDWWDELLDKGNFSNRHHFDISLGTKNARVYTSFFFGTNEGVAIGDTRTDYGGRFNATFKLFDGWLELNPMVDYRQAKRNNHWPNFQYAMSNNPTRSPYDETSATGYNIWINESLDYNVLADVMLFDYFGIDKWFKPAINMKVNIKPVPGLSYHQILGYENRQWENHTYNPSTAREELLESRTGHAYLGFSKIENLTSEGYFSYVNEFKGGHMVNATAGYSYFERNGEGFNMDNYNFSVDKVAYWDIGQGTYLTDGKASMSSSKDVTEKLFAGFARGTYSYNDTYMATASIRYEGSSKFAEDNRWATFWALSGGWRISNEKFMKPVKWVNDLKLRFGYGVTGNNDFSSTYMANLLGSDAYWLLPSGTWKKSYGKTQNVNRDLGWEKTTEWDLGLDFSLFDNRLWGKFDIYRRKIKDMLYSVEVPQPPFTESSQWQNIGSMESKGWELEIGGQIIKNKNFTWTSELNMSHNSGKILTLWGNQTYYDSNDFPAPGSPGTAARIDEGSQIGSFFIWKFAGFDDEGNFLLYDKDNNVIPAADKTELDKRYIGNYIPQVQLGWTNTFRYKNFDASIFLRSWIDFDVYNTIDMYYGIQGKSNLNVLRKTYTEYNNIKGEKQICDFYLDDGTFLKIQNITVGYTFHLKKLTKYVDTIRLYLSGNNLATITGYDGLNPEVNTTGWDQGTEKFWSVYPQSRTFTFGMQFNF